MKSNLIIMTQCRNYFSYKHNPSIFIFILLNWCYLLYIFQAYLLVNIVFGTILLLGKFISGYVFLYVLCMSLCLMYKLAPPVLRIIKKIQQNAGIYIFTWFLIRSVTLGCQCWPCNGKHYYSTCVSALSWEFLPHTEGQAFTLECIVLTFLWGVYLP